MASTPRRVRSGAAQAVRSVPAAERPPRALARRIGSRPVACEERDQDRYLRHTRTSKHRYRFDYEEADHVELLELLKGVPCQVMVSGYGSALYEERLEGWRRVELQVMNHAGVRTECVWMNFPADRLHWARYAGRNFTDRQRIKRKAESWGRRYTALPVAERLAVLGAMMAVEAQR